MIDERALAARALYNSHRSLVEKHTVEHRWVCSGTLRVPDGALVLDEAPGQVFYHYALLDPLSIALADTAALVGSAVLSTFPAVSGADAPHTHKWSLPAAFTPPQPGDRVAVLMLKTRSDDALDEPYIEPWVIGRLVSVDIAAVGD